MIRRSLSIFAMTLAAAGIFSAITFITHSQPRATRSRDKLVITDVQVQPSISLPCQCFRTARHASWADDKIEVKTTVSTDEPLNYHYTVTGGRIVGEGSNVMWDFKNIAPGEYTITVHVDDGIGDRSPLITRKVTVAESCCNCPCECPSIWVRSHNASVRPGDKLDFEVMLAGGNKTVSDYKWTIKNGTIVTGQHSARVEVIADPGIETGSITGAVYLELNDVDCSCPTFADETVNIGGETLVTRFPLKASIGLDKNTVVVDCEKNNKPAPGSAMPTGTIVDVTTYPEGNSALDVFNYSYEVSGGKIVGSGPKVKWDVTGLAPGTYEISATVADGDRQTQTTRVITVAHSDCIWDVFCPGFVLTPAERVGKTDDYIVRASSDQISNPDVSRTWNISGGAILAGQGTMSVRVRSKWKSSDPAPEVTFATDLLSIPGYCRNSQSVFLSKQAPPVATPLLFLPSLR